ncbi:MAG: hypothetical protein LH649_13290 [Pseudanabaena sp. CAN_BIN31]|nr:hypothetical protein [Pseudanabaena sp. CAN_BIN31]
MSINQITLQTMKPTVIKKLQNLARSHQRTWEEEITVILENAVLVDRGVDLIGEDHRESKVSDFWKGLQKFRLTIENDGLRFTDDDFADLRDRSVGR